MTLLNGSLDGIAGGANARQMVRQVTADTVVQSSDQIIECDASAGPITVTWVAGPVNSRQQVQIMKIDGTGNAVSLYDGSSIVAALTAPAGPGAICPSMTATSFASALKVN